MKTNQATAGGRFRIVFLAILGLAAATAWAGIQAPLYVGNVAPVRDQYGRVLETASHRAVACGAWNCHWRCARSLPASRLRWSSTSVPPRWAH